MIQKAEKGARRGALNKKKPSEQISLAKKSVPVVLVILDVYHRLNVIHER